MKTLLAIIYAGLAIYFGYTAVFPEQYVYKNENVFVFEGDTMWDIAAKYRHKNEDIREVVERISKVNDIHKGMIYPGETLVIPVRVDLPDDITLAQKNSKN